MKYNIRPETARDYYRIAEINALAFSTYIEDPQERSCIAEVALIDSLRHSVQFDPSFSLVAELKGEVIGQALFTPYSLWIGGVEHKALSLAPLAVDPAYQRNGVGGALIKRGHELGRQAGFDFAFLLGHTGYYPRFGYQTGMFGACSLDVLSAELPSGESGLLERRPCPADLSELTTLWHRWFDDVDLALFPGGSLMDWVSHSDKYVSNVLVQEDQVTAYIRYDRLHPSDLKLFLARDAKATLQALQYMGKKLIERSETAIHLPLHPNSACAQDWLNVPFQAQIQKWEAAMICPLNPRNEILKAYIHEVQTGQRTQGLLIYPPQVEFA
jgi:predicted N-acetyltransferase YhbS